MTANKRALISKAVLDIEVNAVIYRHTYIRILVFWVRGMYFVDRSIHLIEEHLQTAGFGHRQPRLVTSNNRSRINIFEVPTIPSLSR